MRKLYVSLALLVALMIAGTLPGMAQKDDLQEYINSLSAGGSNQQTRATTSDGFTVVDLSQFGATERTATLDVSNGQKLRFVNGTLSRGNGLTGPVLKIDGGSVVEVSSSDGTYKTSATIDSKKIDYAFQTEAVSLGKGTLTVKNYGWIDGATDLNISGTSVMI